MAKKYSINWEDDQVVSYEVDGIAYASLEDVPNEKDRSKLEAMMEASFDELDREFNEKFDKEFNAQRLDTKPAEKIITRVFFGVAALMLCIAAVSTYFNLQKALREESAPGIVAEVIERREYVSEQDRVYETYYYPVVRFAASDGKTREVQLSEGSARPTYEAGEEVTVLYDPEHPLDARIQSFDSNLLAWILPGITGFLGITFGGVAFAVNKFLFTEEERASAFQATDHGF